MLRRWARALRPGGYLLCSFVFSPNLIPPPEVEFVKKLAIRLTCGNYWYEQGDRIYEDNEFQHVFLSEEHVRSEFAQGRFDLLHFLLGEKNGEGTAGVVLRKNDGAASRGD